MPLDEERRACWVGLYVSVGHRRGKTVDEEDAGDWEVTGEEETGYLDGCVISGEEGEGGGVRGGSGRVKPQRPDLVEKAIRPDYALGPHTGSLGLA